MTDAPFTPDPAAIAADLADDHVHIDPSIADQVTPEQLAAITATVDASTTPIYVIAVPLDYDAAITPVQLATLAHRELPQDGVWYVTRQGGDSWRVESTTYGVSTGNDPNLATYVASELYPSDLGLQLQETVEVLTSGDAEAIYYETFPDRTPGASSTTQSDDGPQLLGVDLPVALVGIGVLAALLVAVAVRRRPRGRNEIVVKERALRRISTAQTDSWRHRAQESADRLGERITRQQITAGADQAAWTAALDHFEAANRVLDRTTSAADSIGALVLAQRGDDALDHAIEGRPWQPTPVCFFNPLHGTATTETRWDTPAGAREVPACADCRRLAGKNKEPDFLDLPIRDTVVHYVDADSDAEPWASSGYGSIDPDLLARVREI
ncbi:MAG: hypothetical protein ABW075_03930 [Aeromicrobium sp.]